MISQAYLRSLLLGIPIFTATGGAVMAQTFSPTREAQVSKALAAATLLAVQKSAIAQQYDHGLPSAALSDLLTALRKPYAVQSAPSVLADSVFAGRGANNNLRLSTTVGADLKYVPESWNCDAASGMERVLCALQQSKYYAEVVPFEVKGDTAVVSVRLFKQQPAAPRLDGLLVRVSAVPETLGWRVIHIRQVLEDPPPGEPSVPQRQ